MKRFKQYVKDKKGVAPEPIHFRDVGKGVAPAPIHFRDVAKNEKKSIKEAVGDKGDFKNWMKDRSDNEHLSKKPRAESHQKEVGQKLAASNKFTPEHVGHIERYADMSHDVNMSLIKGKGTAAKKHEKVTSGLDDAIDKNRIQHPVVTYSGTSFDPRKHVDEKGRMKSPAYISTTHDREVAAGYAQNTAGGPGKRAERHIIRLQLHPGDPATHIAHHSAFPAEHETVIKRGTTLQHHGTEEHWDNNTESWYTIHHMSVAKD